MSGYETELIDAPYVVLRLFASYDISVSVTPQGYAPIQAQTRLGTYFLSVDCHDGSCHRQGSRCRGNSEIQWPAR